MTYGILELLIGISCIAFSYGFHGVMEKAAPFQNLFESPAMKFQIRFLCGCLLVLPTAALMGASFPLIATALDRGDASAEKRWPQAYCANLAGALLAALITPVAIMPVIGLRGALWVCAAIGAAVCGIAALIPQEASAVLPEANEQRELSRGNLRLLLAASFASGMVFFALEVIWTHLIGVVVGSSIYAFSWMLASVLFGLLLGAWIVNRSVRKGRNIAMSSLFLCCAVALLLQLLGVGPHHGGLLVYTPARVAELLLLRGILQVVRDRHSSRSLVRSPRIDLPEAPGQSATAVSRQLAPRGLPQRRELDWLPDRGAICALCVSTHARLGSVAQVDRRRAGRILDPVPATRVGLAHSRVASRCRKPRRDCPAGERAMGLGLADFGSRQLLRAKAVGRRKPPPA